MMKFTNEMVAERLLALIENCRVVDETGEVSFRADLRFSGWQVLEASTDTIQERYPVTVKRAAFVNTEFEFHKSLLDGLRIVRNKLVHSGERTAALESYLSRLDESVASLERAQRNLKRYRTSVLKSAVEGRLVPTEAELSRQRRVEAASRRFVEYDEQAARRRFYKRTRRYND